MPILTPTTDPAEVPAHRCATPPRPTAYKRKEWHENQSELVAHIRDSYRERDAAAAELADALESHADYVVQSGDDCQKCKRIVVALARYRALTAPARAPEPTPNTIAD